MNRTINKRQIPTRSPLWCLLGLLGLTLFASPVAAQVFDSGPSDANLFDAVINLPTDPNIGEFGFFGGDGSTTQINVSEGGLIDEFFSANSGTEVNVSGGDLADFFYAFSGSEINISSGNVGICMDSFDGSLVNISGGTIGDNFRAQGGSEINLFGSNFVLDGVLLDETLSPDEVFTILDREVTFSGLLADGSPFSFELNVVNMTNANFFSPDATLTITLVSEDPEVILGDCDLDGDVDFSDIPPFIEILTNGTFLAEADCNIDGDVDFSDIPTFIEILTGS